MERKLAFLVVVAISIAVLLPAVRGFSNDGFPLSTYSMFSRDRGRISTVHTVVGLDPDGRPHRLSPDLIGGSDEIVLAAAEVSRAVREGKTRALCAAVAQRVAARAHSYPVVQVVSETYDSVAYFQGEKQPRHTQVHASCAPETSRKTGKTTWERRDKPASAVAIPRGLGAQ